MISLLLPLRTVSEANARGHWTQRARRARDQRAVVSLALAPRVFGLTLAGGVVVTLTRLAPSRGLDDDNLAASLKAVRDGVADALGLAEDRDPRVTWRYAQANGRAVLGLPSGYGVRIEIERRTT